MWERRARLQALEPGQPGRELARARARLPAQALPRVLAQPVFARQPSGRLP